MATESEYQKATLHSNGQILLINLSLNGVSTSIPTATSETILTHTLAQEGRKGK